MIDKQDLKDRGFRVLYLTLKKYWFDKILSGEKPEEYREIKPYWTKRLEDKTYDYVCFTNGYAKDSPWMIVEFHGITIGRGRPRWGAEFGEYYYVIELGPVIATSLGEL